MEEKLNQPNDNQGKRDSQVEVAYKMAFGSLILILILLGWLWLAHLYGTN